MTAAAPQQPAATQTVPFFPRHRLLANRSEGRTFQQQGAMLLLKSQLQRSQLVVPKADARRDMAAPALEKTETSPHAAAVHRRRHDTYHGCRGAPQQLLLRTGIAWPGVVVICC